MDTTIATETTNEAPKDKRGVQFGEVRVRQHERILNRRASAKYAGLELGWGHRASDHILVDDFEHAKEIEHHKEHKHQGFERLQRLIKYGYTPKDVLELEKEKKRKLELREKGMKVAEEDEDLDFLEPKTQTPHACNRHQGFLHMFGKNK